MDREERTVEFQELRVADDETGTITGHAAVFDKLSLDLGFFREKIDPGAFTKSLKTADVRALFNHNPNFVLGRTKSGTLSLEEDNRGLAVSISPPDTSYARDLRASMKRGDIDQMSFAFETVVDKWDESTNPPTRTLMEVKLLDVSPVTFPAYPQTNVKARAMGSDEVNWEVLAAILTKQSRGHDLSKADYGLIEETIEALKGYLPVPELPEVVAPVSQRGRDELSRFLVLADIK